MELRISADVATSLAGVRILPRVIALLLGLVLVSWIVPTAVIFISVAIALYALLGARQTVEALILTALLILMSFGDINLGRWLVLFAAFLRTVWDTFVQRSDAPPLVRPVTVFTLAVVLLSILGSYYPLVSILKVLSWAVGVLCMVTAFHRTAHLRDYWLSWFITLGLFILFASLPLYFSGLGYRRNGVGFQGILSHPQTFGPILAPIAALLTGLVLFHGLRSRLVMAGAVLAWFSIYASQARTGLLAVALGLMIVVIVSVFKGGFWARSIGQRLFRISTLSGIAVLGFLVLLNWSAVEQRATGFLVKDHRPADTEVVEGGVSDALEASRGALMARSMRNFWRAPLTGIGLGVPSNFASGLIRIQTGALGLPQGAPVEKGFMATAVLEETGIVGTFLLLLLLIMLVRPVLKSTSPILFWVVASSLLVNAGEAILLSIGGNGFFHWLILTFCYVYARSAQSDATDSLTLSARLNETIYQRGLGSHGRGGHVPAEYPPLVTGGGA